MPRKRRVRDTRDWHEAMMADGPGETFRRRGIDTWDRLHEVMGEFMRKWEAMPEAVRQGYAFPNPEDRR